MFLERFLDGFCHQGAPVLVTLPGPDEYQIVVEIRVLDAKAAAFHDAQPAAIDDLTHETCSTVQIVKKSTNLGDGQHHGQSVPPFGPHGMFQRTQIRMQDFAGEEQQGAERLVLG